MSKADKLNTKEFFEVMEELLDTLDKKCEEKIAQRKKVQEERKEGCPCEFDPDRYEDSHYTYVRCDSFTEALATLIDDYKINEDSSEILGIRRYDSGIFYTICHTDEAPDNFFLVQGEFDPDEGVVDDCSIRPYTITNDDLFDDDIWQVIFKKEVEEEEE